jgi:hypothetical protein
MDPARHLAGYALDHPGVLAATAATAGLARLA